MNYLNSVSEAISSPIKQSSCNDLRSVFKASRMILIETERMVPNLAWEAEYRKGQFGD